MNMQNQLDNRKWLENDGIGGSINLPLENDRIGGKINPPSIHYVDMKEVTPIISTNWITSIFFGLGISGIIKIIELSINKQYSNICLYIILSSLIPIGFILQYIFVTKKYRELKNKAIPFTIGELGDFFSSISPAEDTRLYRDSTTT